VGNNRSGVKNYFKLKLNKMKKEHVICGLLPFDAVGWIIGL
jgi:hypothetical protein